MSKGKKPDSSETCKHYLAVGQLRSQLADLPDAMPVFYHRIENVYFEQYGWDSGEPEMVAEPGFDKDWIRAFSAFTPTIKGKRKRALCITAHYRDAES